MTGTTKPHPHREVGADLADLFRNEARGLLGFFIRRDVPADDAADLVSETFLAAWQSSTTCTIEPDMLRAWLFGIARKKLSQHLRGRTRRTALSARLRLTVSADALEQHASTENMERVAYVRAAIEQLPVVDREIVRLVYWDGFTQEEVALILGKRATSVRARLSRARKVLHDQLADKGPHDVPGAFRERVIGATEGR